MTPLSDIKGFLLDMDGVIYRGSRLIPGALEFFEFLQARSIPHCTITNNSQLTAAQYVRKLATMGINVPERAILTAGQAVADYLAEHARTGARVYVIGRYGLRQPLRQRGFVLTENEPEYVVVGLDTGFSYQKLTKACLAIRGGATFVAANSDATMPTEDAIWPGSGALVAAIEACSGVTPVVVGKPRPTLLWVALDRLGLKPDEAAMVGDRIETDIVAARSAGVTSILVLTGVTTRREYEENPIKPDYVFEDLWALRLALEAATR